MGAGEQGVGGGPAGRTAWRLLAVAVTMAVVLTGCGSGSRPSPSADPTESGPSPSATAAEPGGLVAPGQVTVDPSLPEALRLPAEIWSRTGPGWVLATYSPSVEVTPYGVESQATDATRQVVYLVSPAGVRYQALELPVSPSIMITSWSAGDSRAFVRGCESEPCYRGSGSTAVLDLTTGAITSYEAPAGADSIVATLRGSIRVWQHEGDALYYQHPDADSTFIESDGAFTPLGGGWQVAGGPSPDGKWLGLERWDANADGTFVERVAIAALATAAVRPLPQFDAGLSCSPGGWQEDDEMLLTCYGGNGDGATYKSVVPSTGVVSAYPYTPPGQDEASVWHSVWVSPGVWAGSHGYGDPELWDMESTFGIDDHGTPREVSVLDANGVALQTVGASAAIDGVVYVQGRHSPVDAPGTESVVALDLATGKQTVLLPEPPGGPEAAIAPDDDTVFAVGVTSWVVAP